MNTDIVDTTIAKFYSLKMALDGKRMSSGELTQMFSKESNRKF